MSFSDFDVIFYLKTQSYLKNNNISLSVQDIVHNMKEIATITLQSVKFYLNHKFIIILKVKGKISNQDKKSSFELFGYDFMIDEMMKLHLIEINTNPCIEESSNLLKMILPRMIGILLLINMQMTYSN